MIFDIYFHEIVTGYILKYHIEQQEIYILLGLFIDLKNCSTMPQNLKILLNSTEFVQLI